MSKILIVGIGGVGGYFGGLLAKAYFEDKNVSICFMARGENLQAIRQNGLLVVQGDTQFIAYPKIVSDTASDFGKVDYIIICTKSYHLEETIRNLSACVKANTVFLPLLNGVDNTEKIQAMYPQNLVAYGCAYIIARLTIPGRVENLSHRQRIFFGVENTEDHRLNLLNDIFKKAGIDATLTKDIIARIWEKFIFISATATITSYYNKNFGEIKACTNCIKDLKQLIAESSNVAKHKNIAIPDGVKERLWQLFESVIAEATTSMHADYLAGKKSTEVKSLTGYIVQEAHRLNLAAPKYEEMYERLKAD